MTGKIGYVVNNPGLLFFPYNLLKIIVQQLIPGLSLIFRWLYTGAVDLAVYLLGSVGGEVIIVIHGICRVPLYKIEPKVKIVVKPVRRYRGLLPIPSLVHFKGCGKVLSHCDHWYRVCFRQRLPPAGFPFCKSSLPQGPDGIGHPPFVFYDKSPDSSASMDAAYLSSDVRLLAITPLSAMIATDFVFFASTLPTMARSANVVNKNCL